MIIVCRVCLKKPVVDYVDLEAPFECEQTVAADDAAVITYLDCFRACTQLEVIINNEEAPQCLCHECCNELKVAYNFLLKALEAERVLQERLLDMTEQEEHGLTQLVEDLTDDAKIEYYEIEVEDEIENEIEDEVEVEDEQVVNDGVHRMDDNNSMHDSSETNQEEILPTSEHDANETQILACVVDEDTTQGSDFLIEEAEFLQNTEGDTTKCSDFTSNDFYEEHLSQNNDEVDTIFQCSNCSMNFDSQQALINHACAAVKNDLNPNSPTSRILRCSICPKTFANGVALNAHLKYHQRKEANLKAQACNICGKTFTSQYYRHIHQEQVHRDERELYQCKHCAKMYFSKTALDSHMRIHTGETKKCPVCNKEFVRQYELNVHMRFHTGDYPFSCDVCGKRFAIKGHLRSHMWKHQGLKLQCDECGKLFTSTKALQEHSFIHTEMPFRCSYCDKGYPSKQKYKVHLRRAHFVELDAHELKKVTANAVPKPLQRKKLTLVPAASVVKKDEVRMKTEVKWEPFIETSDPLD